MECGAAMIRGIKNEKLKIKNEKLRMKNVMVVRYKTAYINVSTIQPINGSTLFF